MPRGFALPTDFTVDANEPSQVWIPVQFDPAELSHGNHGYYAAATLARNASAQRATAELKNLTANLTRQGVYPVEMRFEAFAVPVEEEIRGGARQALVPGLRRGRVPAADGLRQRRQPPARPGRRPQREISVRAAIGAGKARLTRQLLTESFVLAAAGGVLGLAFAWVGVRVIAAHGAAGLPALAPIAIDPRMLLFAAALTILTTFLFGLAPALRMLRLNLSESLRDGSQNASAGLRRQSLRGALASAQMALAMVLLLGAGLMLRTLDALMHVDLGFEPEHVLTAPAASARGELQEAGGGRRPLPVAAGKGPGAAGRARRRDRAVAASGGLDRRLGPGGRRLRGDAGPPCQGRLAGHLGRGARSPGRAGAPGARPDAG